VPVLLNASTSHLFWQGKAPEPIEPHHRPFFLAFPRDGESIEAAHKRLVSLARTAASASTDENDLAKIHSVGEPVEYRSFWDHGRTRDVIPVTAKRSFWVPEISDRLFFDHGFYTCEHDIPYRERALADLAAEKDWWLFDTKGRDTRLNVLTYDIEMTQYGEGKRDVPIDVIGWSDFAARYEAAKDLDTEKLHFQFNDLPTDWQTADVTQLVARTPDEEIDILHEFTRKAVTYDMIAGHNVLGFDNKQIHDRIRAILADDRGARGAHVGGEGAASGERGPASLEPSKRAWFEKFTSVYSRSDRSFHFGTSQDIAVWHPVTLDTFHAARKFYFFHDDFTLKGLAPWLGIEVEDRVYLDPDHMALDENTMTYNRHDILEQVGITQTLLAQALPLAFAVDLPLDELLTGGNTKMWDHMAFVRGRRRRKIMPATCRALQVCRVAQRLVPDAFPTREQVSEAALRLPPEDRASSPFKEFVRVAKQGPEMPFWLEHPRVMANPEHGGEDTGYDIVGGLTLKPDADLASHFVPWYHVVEADVGAMYPTILKARNLTADTIQPARRDEKVDEWVWLARVDEQFADNAQYQVRRPTDAESFTQGEGWMIGVKRAKEPGMVNLAMTGILDTIQKVKDARAAAKKAGVPASELRIHDMTYASLKAARNAGTHGILVAVNVSCRQFNMWGGATITTIGQRILHETRLDFERRGIRVVYGDTDGIYLGCSRSAGNLPHLAAALGRDDLEPSADHWITLPDDALAAVADATKRWREELDYEGFELEAEAYDAMVFIVHKNYLKFRTKDGHVVMETKGNNFRGSDKAPVARIVLGDIMKQALADVASWDDEEDARERMRAAIKRATIDIMRGIDVTGTDWEHLTLRQQVRAIKSYKANPDGSASGFAMRTAALEHLIGEPITAARKMRFLVCREPLPGYQQADAQRWVKDRLARHGLAFNQRLAGGSKGPQKSGIKPIEYMWPVDHVKGPMVDWTWYKDTIEAYVRGAFGFRSLELATQRDLSSWF
jgi:DNA polymerase elongation subunit (family B)